LRRRRVAERRELEPALRAAGLWSPPTSSVTAPRSRLISSSISLIRLSLASRAAVIDVIKTLAGDVHNHLHPDWED
jgi:hypothetical protein